MTFNHHVMNICFAVSDGFPFSPTTHIGRSSAKDLCQPLPRPSRSHRLVPNLPKVEETTNLTAMWNPGEMKRKTLQHSRCSVVLCLLDTVGLYLVFTVKPCQRYLRSPVKYGHIWGFEINVFIAFVLCFTTFNRKLKGDCKWSVSLYRYIGNIYS